MMMRAGCRKAERNGGRLDPPMAAILDEAANICRIADLPELHSLGALLNTHMRKSRWDPDSPLGNEHAGVSLRRSWAHQRLGSTPVRHGVNAQDVKECGLTDSILHPARPPGLGLTVARMMAGG
jgi:hypothetical protein